MFESPHATNDCMMSTFQWWSLLVGQYHSGRILSLWRILLVWWRLLHFNLIHHWWESFLWGLMWASSFSHNNLACWVQSYIAWWVTGHNTCYWYCYFHLESWGLRYEGQYHRNGTMVMKNWWYMAQMSNNEWITWWTQCVQSVIWVEEVWEIGC